MPYGQIVKLLSIFSWEKITTVIFNLYKIRKIIALLEERHFIAGISERHSCSNQNYFTVPLNRKMGCPNGVYRKRLAECRPYAADNGWTTITICRMKHILAVSK